MDSTNFFQSENQAVLKSIRAFKIHGAIFYEVGFSLAADPEESIRRVRVSDNLIYADPRAGDLVAIGLLMGNVTHIKKISG